MGNTSNRRKILRLGFGMMGLLALVTIVALGCGTSDTSQAEPAVDHTTVVVSDEAGHGHEQAEGSDEEHSDHDLAAEVVHDAREVVLTATEWAFEPETITVKVGEPITLVLRNDGAIEHGVEVSAFGLHVHAEIGATVKGSFVPDKPGTYEFACEISGHREAGMIGKLVVIE